jgi:ADP-ribosylglycohydrolase
MTGPDLRGAPPVGTDAKPIANCYWVIPERLLAGEYPGSADRDETRERLRRFLDAGFDYFLDLTAPGELEPYDLALPDHVAYVRKPIPDHGLPLEPDHMVEILSYLRDALEDGRRVYLHCRAGIGRTGMTVGCHLVEQGLDGGAALAKLNELWLGCARSQAWPQVPETAEQVEFVRGWSSRREPTLNEQLMEAARTLRDRFQGALLGLAVGDALAAATQFRRPRGFEPIGDLLGGGPFDLPRGAWSDDTAMALCLAESLLESGGFDPRDQMERYGRWQQQGHLSATGQCLGITASVARALATAQWRRQPFSGSHDPERLDPEVLPRVASVVLFRFAQPQLAVREAGDSARATCQAPLVIDLCRLYGAMLHAALSGAGREAVLSPPQSVFRDGSLKPRVATLLRGSYRDKEPGRIRAAADALHVLEAALWAFERSTTFRDGALLAANLGENSDAVTATYGALAGAHYGVGAIPPAWRESLARREIIVDLADRLLAQAMVELGN